MIGAGSFACLRVQEHVRQSGPAPALHGGYRSEKKKKRESEREKASPNQASIRAKLHTCTCSTTPRLQRVLEMKRSRLARLVVRSEALALAYLHGKHIIYRQRALGFGLVALK